MADGNTFGFLFWSTIVALVFIWVLSYSNLPYSRQAANVRYKMLLFLRGLVIRIISTDTRIKYKPDPDQIRDAVRSTKRIIFIRHAESKWNEVFNKGINLKFIGRLFKAIYREIIELPTRDSVFFDSAINATGVKQAKETLAWIENDTQSQSRSPVIEETARILRGAEGAEPSVIVVSNLRRCIETTVVALWGRLHRTGEKVKILSSLQEISKNPDTIALARKNEIPDLPEIEEFMGQPYNNFDVAVNYGDKPIFGTGQDRLFQFAEWVFQQKTNVIIVGCHSLYLRNFIRTFFPYNQDFIGKNSKIHNCGIVTLTLQQGIANGKTLYRIDPDTVELVYNSWEKPSRTLWKPPKERKQA